MISLDTDLDFITPEFLNILFFQQKNLVIFPHVDLKHLSSFDNFTIGYNLIDLESTALFNLKDMLINDSGANYSQTPNLFLIYNLNKDKLKELLELSNIKCILNVNENVSHLINGQEFIFYNKKMHKFLNIEFDEKGLEFENLLISSSKNTIVLKGKLQQLKNTATQIYMELNDNYESRNLPKILNNYDKKYWSKIIEFTSSYFQIEISSDLLKNENINRFSNANKNILDFSDEYESIISKNIQIANEFVQVLHEYRSQHVNPSNLELDQLYNPLSLYNYLRTHHWKDGISSDFLREWVLMRNTNYKLKNSDLCDFEELLGQLKIPNKDILDLCSRLGNFKGVQSKKLELDQKKIEQEFTDKKVPSIEDFLTFKRWAFDRLKKIEHIIDLSKFVRKN